MRIKTRKKITKNMSIQCQQFSEFSVFWFILLPPDLYMIFKLIWYFFFFERKYLRLLFFPRIASLRDFFCSKNLLASIIHLFIVISETTIDRRWWWRLDLKFLKFFLAFHIFFWKILKIVHVKIFDFWPKKISKNHHK